MTNENDGGHVSVLLHEAIDGLDLTPGEIFLDATLGSAGHTSEICRKYNGTVRIVGLDADPVRVGEASELLAHAQCKADIVHENFRNLDRALTSLGISAVQGILFDLGLNSEQLGPSGRGFSFRHDEPLYMTYDEPAPGMLTAYEIVNNYDEHAIADILRNFGEERYAAVIARHLVKERKEKPIRTTFELVDALKRTLPTNYERGRIHFATRTFQALRIAVNDELGALSEGLTKGFRALAPEGRMAVISFHSLEDRIVKQFFRQRADKDEGELVNKKPIYASESEIARNPRSRSASLRIIKKLT